MKPNRAVCGMAIGLFAAAAGASMSACSDDSTDPFPAVDSGTGFDSATPGRESGTGEGSVPFDGALPDVGSRPDTNPPPDAGTPDAPSQVDAPADAPAEAGTDANTDATTDAGTDAGVDAADAALTCGAVDWTNIVNGTIATGTLGAVNVTIAGTGITGGVTDGTATHFANAALYSPALATSDEIQIDGKTPAMSYTVAFDSPVTNPRFYLGSFASAMQFSGTPTLTKVSGDATLVVATNTVTGVVDDTTSTGYDSNGIVEITGTASSLTFDVTFATTDGIYFQVSACH